jgi:hypothetical protein
MRDIQPLKFFGGIASIFGLMGLICGGFVAGWYVYNTETHTIVENGRKVLETFHKTTPFTSLIPIAGVLITLSFLMGVLAMLADMLGRHRKISEEMLYLARRRIYTSRRTVRVSLPPVPEETKQGLSLHDSWSFPVIREIPIGAERVETPAVATAPHGHGHSNGNGKVSQRLGLEEAGTDEERPQAHVA